MDDVEIKNIPLKIKTETRVIELDSDSESESINNNSISSILVLRSDPLRYVKLAKQIKKYLKDWLSLQNSSLDNKSDLLALVPYNPEQTLEKSLKSYTIEEVDSAMDCMD